MSRTVSTPKKEFIVAHINSEPAVQVTDAVYDVTHLK